MKKLALIAALIGSPVAAATDADACSWLGSAKVQIMRAVVADADANLTAEVERKYSVDEAESRLKANRLMKSASDFIDKARSHLCE